MSSAFPLILASGSRYRRELLERLKLPFECIVPDIDETPFENEAPDSLAKRLAFEKCHAVMQKKPDAWIVGSDQVASAQGRLFGKPGTHERALEQLQFLQGKTLDLYTAMVVWNPVTHQMEKSLNHTQLTYAVLPDETLEAYLYADQPYDCAASSKIESLGIGLLETLHTNDPTAIIGLPMITLTTLLRQNGYFTFAK